MTPTFTYNALVERVVDGDTLDVEIDLGFRIAYRVRLRVAHVDTPETTTAAGKQVRDAVRALLPPGSRVTVRTQKPDKYGRALADVGFSLESRVEQQDLASYLLENGMAREYEGGARG